MSFPETHFNHSKAFIQCTAQKRNSFISVTYEYHIKEWECHSLCINTLVRMLWILLTILATTSMYLLTLSLELLRVKEKSLNEHALKFKTPACQKTLLRKWKSK